MTNQELTAKVIKQISKLKQRVDTLPGGGCLQILEMKLKEIIQSIKDRFKMFLDDENVLSRYLLSKVLFEILSVEGKRSKEQIRSHAMNEHGCVIMPKPDDWIDN